MATLTTDYDARPAATSTRHHMLRRMIGGAAAFDAGMGVACLAAASELAGWLGVQAGTVRVTGVVFLLAAAAGGLTLRRTPVDVRAIVGANALFAVWSLAILGLDSPSALGVGLLLLAAASSAGTAVTEWRLAAGR